MSEYLKRDIARILKKPPRTIEFWTASGLVIPDIEPSQGKGKPRVYSGRNLLEFAVIALMTRMDIPLDIIKYILSVLRKGEWTGEGMVSLIANSSDLSDEEKERKQEHCKKLFEDFWTSKEWGISKEVVYVSKKQIWANHPEKVWRFDKWDVVQMRKNLLFQPFPDVSGVKLLSRTSGFVETVFWLGYIKNTAAEVILA